MGGLGGARWRPTRTSLGFRIATWTFWYWRFDALADERHFTELEDDTALEALPAEPGGVRHILPSYPVSVAPPRLRRIGPWLVYTPKTFPNYFVDLRLDGGFDAYLLTFSSKTRSTLRRKVRRFAEASPGGELDVRAYRTPAEVETFLGIAAGLSSRTYQARLFDVGLPESEAFRREAIGLAQSDRIRAFLLYLGEKPAAYVFCTCRDGVVSYDYVGHDPDLNSLSPGTVLQYKLLEHLFEDPSLRIFDFTEGEGEHKALFATGHRTCAKSIAFPNRPPVRLLLGLHAGVERADALLDRTLEKLSVKQRLRRFMRRGGATAT